MLDFIPFSILDVLDILLVAILLFYIYKLLKGTVAINIFIGIAFIFLIWKITQALSMEMLSGILGYLLSGGVIALIIVFQQEIRKFLLMIGTTNFSSKKSFLNQLKFLQSEISSEIEVDKILKACYNMSKTKTGALIVIEKTNSLDFLINNGDLMNALVNEVILESIFFKNSPL
ncbi:MAG: diadenylate cyclase, partial [Polaribacter sp.]|nr:diadenylate cyclase [Polaribacter sp.]